jgi:hypothetical protein
MPRRGVDPVKAEKALEAHAAGASYDEIRKILGCSMLATCQFIKDHGLKHRERLQAKPDGPDETEVKAEARRQWLSLPPDTRDLTGRLMGDPIPGRRALDKIKHRDPPF